MIEWRESEKGGERGMHREESYAQSRGTRRGEKATLTHGSVNDDVFSAQEEGSLARISSIWDLVEEQSIVRPVKMLFSSAWR